MEILYVRATFAEPKAREKSGPDTEASTPTGEDTPEEAAAKAKVAIKKEEERQRLELVRQMQQDYLNHGQGRINKLRRLGHEVEEMVIPVRHWYKPEALERWAVRLSRRGPSLDKELEEEFNRHRHQTLLFDLHMQGWHHPKRLIELAVYYATQQPVIVLAGADKDLFTMLCAQVEGQSEVLSDTLDFMLTYHGGLQDGITHLSTYRRLKKP